MAGALQGDEPGTGDQRGDLGGVGRSGQRVLRAAEDQRGDLDAPEAGGGVVGGADEGGDLAVEAVARLLEDDGPQEVDEQPERPGRAGAEEPGEGPAGPGVHALGPGRLLPTAQQLEAPGLVAAGGAGQGQRPEPVGVLDGQHLGDVAAHGVADDVGPADPLGVEDGDGVGRHLLQRVGPLGFVGAARPPVVEGDAAEPAAEDHPLAGPDAQVGGQARDEQERLAPPPRLVVDDRAVTGLGRRHFSPLSRPMLPTGMQAVNAALPRYDAR